MAKNNKTMRFGVIGNPISHSLSPNIHRLWIKHFNLQASYDAILVEDLEAFFLSAKNTLAGFNVTVPFKEQVLAFCDELSPEVSALGAANTIVNENGRWKAYNTDGLGFMRSVEEQLSLSVINKEILVFGAGGSAKAVIASLIKNNVKRIYICNRTQKNAVSIKDVYSETFSNIECVSYKDIYANAQFLKNVSLVVNTTSVGLNKPEDCLIADDAWLHSQMRVIDLIYKPVQTALLKQAKEKNLLYVNGLGMLVYQAAYAFTYFTGKGINTDLAEAAFKEVSQFSE